jgi:hypothetical protein
VAAGGASNAAAVAAAPAVAVSAVTASAITASLVRTARFAFGRGLEGEVKPPSMPANVSALPPS